MKIAFSTLPLESHTFVLTALARGVQALGHEVVFIGFPNHEPLIQSAGFKFIRFCETRYAPGSIAEHFRPLIHMSGMEGVEHTLRMMCELSRATLEDGARAVRESGAEALVIDFASKGLEAIAMTMEIPFVHVCAALHSDYTGYTPLPIYDWPYESGPKARSRNIEGLLRLARLAAPNVAILREYLDRAGVSIDWADPGALTSKLAVLTQIPKEFDFPSQHWPENLIHTGPFHDGFVRSKVDFPWERLTGEPLIYASMGTLLTESPDVFRVIADAAQSPNRQLVLSIGHDTRRDQLGPLNDNTIVVQRAPQLELLKRAALCITHGGANTVLESLAQGVPLVCIPVTNDQPGIAARIAFTRTGLFCPVQTLETNILRSMVNEVLTDPIYGENARRMQRAIAKTNGLEVASRVIDNSFRAFYHLACSTASDANVAGMRLAPFDQEPAFNAFSSRDEQGVLR